MSQIEQRLLKKTAKACIDFNLIEPNDRIMVCVSGGKDSFAMLHLLRKIQRKAPFDFSIIAVNLDQGHPGFPVETLRSYLTEEEHEFRILQQTTYKIVLEKTPPGKAMCTLCSRLRRGILYNAAEELGCTKIALGHHRDDANETLLLNLFFSGQLKSMPPRLTSDDKRNVVIRPLIYCAEKDIETLAAENRFPIIPCDLCGTQENLQRQRIKRLIASLEGEIPEIRNSMLAALSHVRPTHLHDRDLLARSQPQHAEEGSMAAHPTPARP